MTTISPKVVLEQKLVLRKYTSGISDVIFHAEVKKAHRLFCSARIRTPVEQGLSALTDKV